MVLISRLVNQTLDVGPFPSRQPKKTVGLAACHSVPNFRRCSLTHKSDTPTSMRQRNRAGMVADISLSLGHDA